MGQSHCICKQEPCVCFNGWGTHFQDETELLATISGEISAEYRRRRYYEADVQAVEWMVSSGYEATQEEIAETLGLSVRNVRRILRVLGAKAESEED